MRLRDKPVWHASHAAERGREICAAEHPHYCLIRLKGTRQLLRVPWTAIYLWAARHEAEQARKQKIAERKARRKARQDA